MAKWTAEQQAAIDARGCNLLVAAAAGSGKTAVLVERILQLIIRDHVDIDSLLVVTFTNAAAGEMRERIGAALTKAIDGSSEAVATLTKAVGSSSGADNGSSTDSGDSADNSSSAGEAGTQSGQVGIGRSGSGSHTGNEESEHLRKQLNLLSKASISTLHAFCISVIRKYFHLINIDPGFRIGDETECSIIKLEVLEDLFEKEYEKASEEFLGLAERFGDNRQDVALQDLVLRLYEFVQSKPYPAQWLNERVQDFALPTDETESSPWFKALAERIRIDIAGAVDLLREALDICRKPNGPSAYEYNIHDDISQLESLVSVLDARGFRAFCTAYSGLKFSKLKPCGKDVDEDLKEKAKDLREDMKKLISRMGGGLLDSDLDHIASQLNELYPYMHYLCTLVTEFDREYKAQKQEKGIIDFNDLEHYTLEILEHEEAAGELRQRYKYIFVDEYQDSNIVQETILNRICRTDNMFMVGDVKQSIYRFRLADPSIFLSKYGTYTVSDSALNRRIDLNRNFRSRPQILDGVNYIFEHIMSAKFGELDYDQNAALYKGLDMQPIDSPEIELHLVEKSQPEEGNNIEPTDESDYLSAEAGPYSGSEENDGFDSAYDSSYDSTFDSELGNGDLSDIEIEAMVAAQRIKELLETDIYDSALETYRKVQYRDIVILMRSTKGWAAAYADVLEAMGIPVYADINSGYFEALEIKTAVSLLKLIDNKCQDIPLLTVLRSPIGGFNADDLIQIRTFSRARLFHKAAAEYMEKNSDEISERLKAFYQSIEKWQQASKYLSMEDFIWKLYTESGYYYYAGAMPGGLQRQANLRILLDRARRFSQTSIKGLFQFIRFIEKLQGSSGDMGSAKILGENENVLRIMSIHKSKGLEFPIVIVAGLGKQFNMTDMNASVLFHKDLGLGPRYVNPDTRQLCETAAKAAIKHVIRMESLSEEMRILYVALTRPKDRLILLGSVRGLGKAALQWAKKISPYMLSNGKTFLDWICPVLMRHNDCAPLRDLLAQAGGANTFDEPLVNGPSGWSVILHNRGEISAIESESILNKQVLLYRMEHPAEFAFEADDELKRLIDERFSWKYPYKFAVDIPSKLTVTEIKQVNYARAAAAAAGTTATLPMTVDPNALDVTLDASAILRLEAPDADDGRPAHIPADALGPLSASTSASASLSALSSAESFSKRNNGREFANYKPSLIERPKFMEGTKQFTAAEKGTIMHFVLQHIDFGRVEETEMIRQQVGEMVAKELLTEDEGQIVDIDIIHSFYCSDIGRRIINAPRVWREVPFNYRKEAAEVIDGLDQKGETLLIQGVIDCYFEENGKWVLVDYKTDYVESEDSINKLINRYRVQVELYAEALEKITGKPVGERILYLLSINRAVSI